MKNCVILPKDDDPKYLGIFTKNRLFYRNFFSLLLVIGLQQMAALMVNMLDNIMLGTYSELALSGATLVNQVQFMLQQMAAGIGLGIVVLASQYWGQRRIEPIKKIISIGLLSGVVIGLLFLICTMLFPHTILSLFTEDESVIAEASRYLKIICWTYLIFSVSNSLMYALQAVETVWIGTIMALSTICINFCLNYVLIFGHFGFPEMGIRGAALATVISRSAELVIILVYVLKKDKKLGMKAKDFLVLDMPLFKDYIKVATPVVFTGMLWGVAQGSQTMILGHISSSVIAANSIAMIVFQCFAVFGNATVNVSSVVTGKTIGQGKLHLVRSYVKTMQGIFLVIGLLSGLMIFIFKDAIVGIYNISDETRELALSFLTILSVTAVGSCYEYPVMGGIIAGGGDTKFTAIIDNAFMWGFTLPLGYLSAFVFKYPPEITFLCLKIEQILKCIPNAIVCNRFRFIKILTK